MDMKKSSLLKAVALSLALLPAASGFTAAFAQGAPPHDFARGLGGHGGKGGHMLKNEELRTYTKQTIMPVVRQQRQKLDAQMSSADRKQLDTYRAQLKALREQGKALHQSFRPEGAQPGQRPELTEAQRQQLQQLHSEQRGVMLNVAQLAQKYDAQITKLADEVKPQREKWATDIKAIMVKNATPEQQQRMQQLESKGGEGRGFGRGHFHGLVKQFAPTRFMLMDPKAPIEQEETAERGGSAALYPNPASATQRLDYNVAKDGTVKVELLDERGKTLRTLVDTKQDEGGHSLDVSLADLPRGTYYYKITTKGNTETRRFVKE
jgi:Spy/CpxP family protein refolding chaperone